MIRWKILIVIDLIRSLYLLSYYFVAPSSLLLWLISENDPTVMVYNVVFSHNNLGTETDIQSLSQVVVVKVEAGEGSV